MFNWLRKVFSNTAPMLIEAAVAVARVRLNESIDHTDKLDPIQKEMVRELIKQFIADLLSEVRK